MRPGPPSTLLVLALLLAIAGAPGATAGPAAVPGDDPVTRSSSPALQIGPPAPNGTVIEVRLEANGDARWTVTQSFNLTDENDTRAFGRLATEFEQGEIGGDYLATIRRANDVVNRSTERSMSIRNVTRETTVVDGTGLLVTSFTWTSFARVTGDTARVGDVFTIQDGTETWFPGLADDEQLVVGPPPGYRIDDAPSADSFRNGSLVWEGPTEFEPGYLTITYRKLTPPPEPPGGTDTVTPPSPPGPFEGQILPIVGGVFGLGVLLLVAYLLLGREGPLGPIAEANGGTDVEESEVSADGPDGTDGPAGAAEAGADPAAEPEPIDEDEDEDEEPDLELLSDEERVEHLLRKNGGRMKQANIVRETNWSNAKVSQLLSGMDEAGRVDKLRIGRENLISLPDEKIGDFEE